MASAARRWIGLVVISLAVALIIVDSTIVNVAIPSIVDDLGITSTQVQWVQESYTIVFAALLLTFGTIADRVGRRRMMVIGITIFSLASVARIHPSELREVATACPEASQASASEALQRGGHSCRRAMSQAAAAIVAANSGARSRLT